MKSYVISRINGAPDWKSLPSLSVSEILWLPDAGIRMTQAICHDDENIFVHQRAVEESIRAELFGTDCPVCEDSCMEFFFSPCPDDGRYFNIETNPNGCFFSGFGHGREDLKRLYPAASVFDIRTQRTPDGWEVFYRIPLSFIREFYPDYAFTSGMKIRANCYKCGDKAAIPHYLGWNHVSCETPDFHRPEFFGEMIFE